ncbi:MAG: T9SS type A sorting domain-containing protein [Bacteroidia bacterium]|nr:T9SS type A sorting domain-containing protein [Bacteroidia bacterium]
MKHFVLASTLLLSALTSISQSVVKTINIGGTQRQYKLYVPASYNGSEKVPLVFCFHGLGDNMDNFENIGMTFVADTANFIVITPQAATDALAGTAWNSGAGVSFGGFEYFPNQNVDDIGFINAMIDTTASNFNLDMRRIYACGFSMGGYMTNRVACELNDRIAAFAPVAATIGAGITCNPGRALPLITFHGTSDATVAYDTASFGSSVPQLLDFWANNNGCASMDSSLVPDIANDGYHITHFTYGNCSTDGALEHFKVYGAQHTWLGPSDDIFYTTEIWKFFMRYQHPNQSLGLLESEVNSNIIFPNPIGKGQTIEISLPRNEGSIQIMDMNGQLIQLTTTDSGKLKINSNELNSGMYLVSFTDRNGEVAIRKLIVE